MLPSGRTLPTLPNLPSLALPSSEFSCLSPPSPYPVTLTSPSSERLVPIHSLGHTSLHLSCFFFKDPHVRTLLPIFPLLSSVTFISSPCLLQGHLEPSEDITDTERGRSHYNRVTTAACHTANRLIFTAILRMDSSSIIFTERTEALRKDGRARIPPWLLPLSTHLSAFAASLCWRQSVLSCPLLATMLNAQDVENPCFPNPESRINPGFCQLCDMGQSVSLSASASSSI